MFFNKMLLSIATILMVFGGFLWSRGPAQFPQEASPNNDLLLKKLRSSIASELVFDSNRGGTFGLYIDALDGSEPRVLYSSETTHEMFPDPSPDGRLVAFARHATLEREDRGEIWVVGVDGAGARKIADNGTFPTFSADGKSIYFERERRKVIAVALDFTGELNDSTGNAGSATEGTAATEVELFPGEHTEWAKYFVVKPRVSKDGRYVYFTTDRSGRWNAYFADLQTGEAGHVGRGCEPAPFHSPGKVAWITKTHVLSKSGIGVFTKENSERAILQDAGPPYGHEYFPTIAPGDRFLMYAACPGSQHDHTSANYQIFIRDLTSDEVVRVTHDVHTNRWPKVLPARQ